MTIRTHYLAAAAAIGALAIPAAAQTAYPYGYQQTYPQAYPQQTYPQQAYPQQAYPDTAYGYRYNQGTTGNPVTDIIDSLLGNRYNVTDRQAVRQCVNAARAEASQQYGGYANGEMRVTAISNVQRRGNGLRVSGTLGSAYASQYGNQYGNQNGYQNGYRNRGYGHTYAAANVSFRCNVAYNGAVTGIRIGRAY